MKHPACNDVGDSVAVTELLKSHQKLERDRALEVVRTWTKEQSYGLQSFEEHVIAQLSLLVGVSWEERQGLLSASSILIQSRRSSKNFNELILPAAIRCLVDDEVRVRLSAGDVIGFLCADETDGVNVFKSCIQLVSELVRGNIERKLPAEESERHEKLIEKLSTSSEEHMGTYTDDGGKTASEIFHQSAGWRYLESSMHCLRQMIHAAKDRCLQFIDESCTDLILITLRHSNRFVRETGFSVLAAVIESGALESHNSVQQQTDSIIEVISVGLSDNWSQVRLAASIVTRHLFQSALNHSGSYHRYLPPLIGPMCLNRYYLAEGVRLYSQETWRLVFGEEGRNLVKLNISTVVEFYCKQSDANNHAVREAACHCMAELALKIASEVVENHVDKLISSLLICFDDDSWPVRDSACLACASYIHTFPDKCRPFMDKLYPLFWNNLSDCIPSVRHGAAESISKVFKSFGTDAERYFIPKMEEGFTNLKNQPSDSKQFDNLQEGTATFGNIKRAYAQDELTHTNQTMYSCGSLAPKMGRGGGGGCSDHGFRQPSQPWHVADGCIHLVAEMSSTCKEQSMLFLPKIAEACAKRDYVHHMQLIESVCLKLGQICAQLGKQTFKRSLELFVEPIFYALNSDNKLANAAASDCLISLAKQLGPNILRGRIQMHSNEYVDRLNAVLPPY